MKTPTHITEMSDDYFLEQLDDYGDGWSYIHEAARRIRLLHEQLRHYCHVCKVVVGERHLGFCSVGRGIFYRPSDSADKTMLCVLCDNTVTIKEWVCSECASKTPEQTKDTRTADGIFCGNCKGSGHRSNECPHR